MTRNIEIFYKTNDDLHIYMDKQDYGVGIKSDTIADCRKNNGEFVDDLVLVTVKDLDEVYSLSKLETDICMSLLRSKLKDENTIRQHRNIN